jgi:hypothetical protein
MSEEQLRVDVLMPLFTRMGFLDVQDYHGGPLEQGKDIVMWKRTEFGRVNYAVVVKAGRITGQAAPEKLGSAGAVIIQIRQCFGKPFIDRGSAEEREVSVVLVVCPHEIKKEALQTIRSGIGDGPSRSVRYLHGDGLWQAVREHLGPRSALALLQDIGAAFESGDPNYRVVAQAKGAKISISLEPKHATAATDVPLEVKGTFEFPNDGPGMSAAAELRNHFETGAPVTVAGKYIKEWSLPPILRELFGDGVSEMRMEPRPLPQLFPMVIHLQGAGEKTVVLPEFAFRCIQKGTKEATFTAERPPYTLRLVLHEATRQASLTVAMLLVGSNVSAALQAVQARELLSSGCSAVFRDANTGLVILTAEVPAGSVPPFPPEFEDLFSELDSIQQKTNQPLTIPDREVTYGDLQTARGLGNAVRTGVVPIEVKDVSAVMARKGVHMMVATSDTSTVNIALLGHETAKLIDAELRLGPVARIINGAFMQPAEKDRLIREMQEDPSKDAFHVTVDCSRGTSKAVYLDHVPPEERAVYRAMFPDFDTTRPTS